MGIAHNVQVIQERVARACRRTGRDPGTVRLVAVTKTVCAERIREAMACGLSCFGENYVQEALPKIRALGPGPEWHFIGHLQGNKARLVVGPFSLIHTLDRPSLALELDRRAAADSPVPVLVQVNISGEATKSGTTPQTLAELVRRVQACPNLRLRGLMTIPPLFDDPEGARPFFRALGQWRDRLRGQVSAPHSLEELSMGMTGDFEAAIEEGATLVRIGTAIFGARPAR
jgi:hypothetical protein